MWSDDFDQEGEAAALNRAERLLITIMRRLVTGMGLCQGVLRELEVLSGAGAGQVLLRTHGFLATLARAARRKLTIAPLALEPTADERGMLAMISAAQSGDDEKLVALVSWFARRDLQPLLREAVHAIADVLLTHNLRVRARPPLPGRPPRATPEPAAGRGLGVPSSL